MGTTLVLHPTLSSVVEAALHRFQPHGGAVSVTHIRDAVRLDYPECDLPDVLLTKYIGDQAICQGFNVHFDTGATELAI